MHIGCDIVDIRRIKRAMQRGGSFPSFLSEAERKRYHMLTGNRQAEWLAGRFAAKEAVVKAMHGKRELLISEVEILCDEAGAPVCTIEGVQVSIAHEAEYAIAYALAQW